MVKVRFRRVSPILPCSAFLPREPVSGYFRGPSTNPLGLTLYRLLLGVATNSEPFGDGSHGYASGWVGWRTYNAACRPSQDSLPLFSGVSTSLPVGSPSCA